MITEDFVSFELAKLLKEKGFDSECRYVYNNDGEKIAAQIFTEGESVVSNYDIERIGKTNGWINYLQETYAFLCPTLQMAMKWLRKVHNLFIEPYYTVFGFRASVTDTKTENTVYTQADEDGYYASPELSCESIIRYCLENLI